MIDRPVRFKGTEAERRQNRLTHQFGGIDDRCYACDAKPSHIAADYPCGTPPPREQIYPEDQRILRPL